MNFPLLDAGKRPLLVRKRMVWLGGATLWLHMACAAAKVA